MKKSIMLIVIICFFYTCKENNDKEINLIENKKSIEGNWYYFLKEEIHTPDKNYTKTYNEVFVNDKKVYHNLELVGFIRPEEYIVSKDSFYLKENKDLIFRGKIENLSRNGFDLTFNSQVINYHRIKSGVTLGDIILKVDSLDSYIKDYNNRLLKAKKENVY